MNHSYWRGDFKDTRLKPLGLWCSAHTNSKCACDSGGSYFCCVDSLSTIRRGGMGDSGSEISQIKGSMKFVYHCFWAEHDRPWHLSLGHALLCISCSHAIPLGDAGTSSCLPLLLGPKPLTFQALAKLQFCISQVPATPVAMTKAPSWAIRHGGGVCSASHDDVCQSLGFWNITKQYTK